MQTDDLLTSSEVARLLQVSVPTINRWAGSGRLPSAQKLPGIRGAYLFRRSDVEAFASERAA